MSQHKCIWQSCTRRKNLEFFSLGMIRSWPCTTTSNNTLDVESLTTFGVPPSLFLLNTQTRTESHFGIIPGAPGSHTTLSDETRKYPYFATLLSGWRTQFSQEWLRDSSRCPSLKHKTCSISQRLMTLKVWLCWLMLGTSRPAVSMCWIPRPFR